jgi:hypothetical protein
MMAMAESYTALTIRDGFDEVAKAIRERGEDGASVH